MSKRDEQDMQIAKQQLMLKSDDPLMQRFNVILDKGLKFHEWIWDDDPEITYQRRTYMEDNPKEFAARFKSFGFLFGKLIASRVSHQVTVKGGNAKITPETLAALNLSPQQIEILAGVNEKG